MRSRLTDAQLPFGGYHQEVYIVQGLVGKQTKNPNNCYAQGCGLRSLGCLQQVVGVGEIISGLVPVSFIAWM